jgi:hypothetical protein
MLTQTGEMFGAVLDETIDEKRLPQILRRDRLTQIRNADS